MSRPLRHFALTAIALGGALASTHCQRDPGAPDSAAASECCELTPNAALPQGMGSIVVRYPGAESTRLDVYGAGDASRAIKSDYGDTALELAPGTYDVTVGGRRVSGVGVKAGHETRVRTGVLHVHASDATRIDLVDPANGEKLASGYGETQYGLPIGSIAVEIAGQQDTALIEDGKVTDF